MLVVDTLAELARPWAETYRAHDVLQFGIHAAHLGGITFAGGTALAADRMALRLGRRPPAQRQAFLAHLQTRHARVLTALSVVAASGLLLLGAHVPTLLPSPVYWLKMTLLATLLWNGSRLRATGRRLHRDFDPSPDAWAPLATYAGRSVALWFAIALMGVILTTVD